MNDWQTETGRKALLYSFIEGFGACRKGALVTAGDYGFHVALYDSPGRSGEYFACEPVSNELLTKLKPDEWLTVVGDVGRLMPAGQNGLKVLVDELFMLADIAALEQSSEEIEAFLVRDPAQIATINASGEISPFEPNDRSFLFVVTVEGSAAATARYGVADDGDIVVDRVSTAPAFRRRGLARRVMMALAAHAARAGHRRALLISSDQGEPLYRSLGYQVVAPVRVFAAA
ncbi:MAG: GNAT family N-acetyltransferase [Rhizobiaceae bacterium]